MLFKTVDINGEQHLLTCFEEGDDGDLTFYILNSRKNVGYTETMPKNAFQLRLKMLNPRVKFPEDAVRRVLVETDPLHAELVGSTLSLKYTMANTTVPLKWNWHLISLNSAQFYRQICIHSMATAGVLQDQVLTLIEVLRSKDNELKQYRIEGCKLRRVTAVTKPFNIEAFMEEHQKLLDDARAYQKVKDIFALEIPANPSSAFSSPMLEEAKVKTPSTGSMETFSSKLSPRNRKRKALESNTNHMERKVMQRRSKPQIEYKNSQSSQETNVDDWLTESKPNVKEQTIEDRPSTSASISQESVAKLSKINATVGTAQIKSEPVQEIGSSKNYYSSSDEDLGEPERSSDTVEIIPQKPASVQEILDSPALSIEQTENPDSQTENGVPKTGLSELDEIKAILNRATAITKKVIEKHGVNK
ncbi:uncharacterized protein LOC128264907 isoform X1 [Drosophila gunungcola]|uniref:uncharacterized protein LOC128264907 isoform X1 n=1 Tax=Drosophila gunungcola TaxID=103775 RepID=UPI0022E60489|nr:uncharacterized protein LOC128264907 isoform X1 [Drosophila gunungcola]